MAITALHSAATGLRALSTRIDVIANNLANAETNSFKRSRANFEDLMYLELRQPGTTNSAGDVSPAGISVGLGTRLSNTQIDMTQGSLEPTNNPLDVAISGGTGFFKVKIANGIGDGFAYTRNGAFFINKDHELVVGMKDGYRVVPSVTLPSNTNEVSIANDGTISVKSAGALEFKPVGQLKLHVFPNPSGLKLLGGSLYQTNPASGEPLESLPGENGAGELLSGNLEGSNVDPVTELVTLIKTQRAFELNSQSIQSADQALQTIANLRRG